MKWILLFSLLGTCALLATQLARASELPQAGQPAPYFSLPDQNGLPRSLGDFSGKWLALYFYPKDDTPGCTREACTFRNDLHLLTEMGTQVVGISVDDSDSHEKFTKN